MLWLWNPIIILVIFFLNFTPFWTSQRMFTSFRNLWCRWLVLFFYYFAWLSFDVAVIRGPYRYHFRWFFSLIVRIDRMLIVKGIFVICKVLMNFTISVKRFVALEWIPPIIRARLFEFTPLRSSHPFWFPQYYLRQFFTIDVALALTNNTLLYRRFTFFQYVWSLLFTLLFNNSFIFEPWNSSKVHSGSIEMRLGRQLRRWFVSWKSRNISFGVNWLRSQALKNSCVMFVRSKSIFWHFWVLRRLSILEDHTKIRIIWFINGISELLIRLVILRKRTIWKNLPGLSFWFFISNICFSLSTSQNFFNALLHFTRLIIRSHLLSLFRFRPAGIVLEYFFLPRRRRLEMGWGTAWIHIARSALLPTWLFSNWRFLCFSWSDLILVIWDKFRCFVFLDNRILLRCHERRLWNWRSLLFW